MNFMVESFAKLSQNRGPMTNCVLVKRNPNFNSKPNMPISTRKRKMNGPTPYQDKLNFIHGPASPVCGIYRIDTISLYSTANFSERHLDINMLNASLNRNQILINSLAALKKLANQKTSPGIDLLRVYQNKCQHSNALTAKSPTTKQLQNYNRSASQSQNPFGKSEHTYTERTIRPFDPNEFDLGGDGAYVEDDTVTVTHRTMKTKNNRNQAPGNTVIFEETTIHHKTGLLDPRDVNWPKDGGADEKRDPMTKFQMDDYARNKLYDNYLYRSQPTYATAEDYLSNISQKGKPVEGERDTRYSFKDFHRKCCFDRCLYSKQPQGGVISKGGKYSPWVPTTPEDVENSNFYLRDYKQNRTFDNILYDSQPKEAFADRKIRKGSRTQLSPEDDDYNNFTLKDYYVRQKYNQYLYSSQNQDLATTLVDETTVFMPNVDHEEIIIRRTIQTPALRGVIPEGLKVARNRFFWTRNNYENNKDDLSCAKHLPQNSAPLSSPYPTSNLNKPNDFLEKHLLYSRNIPGRASQQSRPLSHSLSHGLSHGSMSYKQSPSNRSSQYILQQSGSRAYDRPSEFSNEPLTRSQSRQVSPSAASMRSSTHGYQYPIQEYRYSFDSVKGNSSRRHSMSLTAANDRSSIQQGSAGSPYLMRAGSTPDASSFGIGRNTPTSFSDRFSGNIVKTWEPTSYDYKSDYAPRGFSNKLQSDINDLLIIGGHSDEKPTFSNEQTIYKYSHIRDQWASFVHLPEPRFHHSTAKLDNYLYLSGGCRIKDETQPECATFRFNYNMMTWSILAPMRHKRMRHRLCSVLGMIYAIGGQNEHGDIARSVECYNPGVNEWRFVTSMSEGRVYPAVASCRDRIYVAGGYGEWSPFENTRPVLSSVEYFDPRTNRWTKVSPLPYPRYHATMLCVADRLFIVGGAYQSRKDKVTLLSSDTIDMYDPRVNRWQHVTNMTTPRHAAGTSLIGRKIYIVGGISCPANRFVNSIEIFDIETLSWCNSCPFACRSFDCVAVS